MEPIETLRFGGDYTTQSSSDKINWILREMDETPQIFKKGPGSFGKQRLLQRRLGQQNVHRRDGCSDPYRSCELWIFPSKNRGAENSLYIPHP